MYKIKSQFFLLSFIIFTILVSQAELTDQDIDGRSGKYFNVFKVVQFPNAGCNTTTTGRYGVCYTSTECTSLGGSAAGSCASGFGVCCSFNSKCGDSINLNNTYFTNTDSDSSPCSVKVCKTSSDICQIRLNFDTFQLSQPSTVYPGDGDPSSRGTCIQARFTAESDGPSPPIICGTNSGHHMILDAKDNCNSLTFSWQSSSTTHSWNIQVMQISCEDHWRPASGCLQYFTGTSGTIKSYNYDGGYHLANQQYNNCIRTEAGYCSISYAAVSDTTFQISLIAPAPGAAIAQIGDSCTQDWIVIPGGGSTVLASTNSDRFCGSYLSYTPAGTSSQTIKTQKMPFKLEVNFDDTELDSSSANEWSLGFSIYYSQTAC